MGFLDKLFGARPEEEVDIEEFLNTLGDEEEYEEEDVQRYVKPFSLTGAKDFDAIMAEINKGNILLLNIRPIASKNALTMKEVVTKVKDAVTDMGGDIARITEYYLLVTPPGIKIIKRRSQ